MPVGRFRKTSDKRRGWKAEWMWRGMEGPEGAFSSVPDGEVHALHGRTECLRAFGYHKTLVPGIDTRFKVPPDTLAQKVGREKSLCRASLRT